jgi:hypothetical protein
MEVTAQAGDLATVMDGLLPDLQVTVVWGQHQSLVIFREP